MIPGIAELDWVDMVARLGLAALLGAVLGLEREWDGQDAGFRTHLLVVLGSALFGVISVGGFDDFVAARGSTNVTVDVTRIAAYVAPGIGFIGGGAIIKYGGKVKGITTAASLWSGAAIGVAAGLGAWQSAVVATAITLVALEGLKPLSIALGRLSRKRSSAVSIEVDRDCDLAAMFDGIDAAAREVKELTIGWGPDDDGLVTVQFWTNPSSAEMHDLVQRLRPVEGVRTISRRRSTA